MEQTISQRISDQFAMSNQPYPNQSYPDPLTLIVARALLCLGYSGEGVVQFARSGHELGQVPLLCGGGRGGLPPLQTYDSFFLLRLSIFTCKIGLNCSEMLLPADSVRNSVTFAHLRYLKIILRFCVEGRLWVRVGISRAVKGSM